MDEEIDRIEVEEQKSVDEEVKEQPKQTKPKKRKWLKGLLLGLLVVVLMGGSAGAAYWWRDNDAQDTKKELQAEIDSLKKEKQDLKKELEAQSSSEPVACSEVQPTDVTTVNTKAAITSGNTAALSGYMAPSVNVILAASSAYGIQSASQAVANISSFLGNDSSAWDYDFELSQAEIDDYRNGDYAEYFVTNSIVGKSSADKVISVSFDCNGKISTVFMSPSSDIL